MADEKSLLNKSSLFPKKSDTFKNEVVNERVDADIFREMWNSINNLTNQVQKILHIRPTGELTKAYQMLVECVSVISSIGKTATPVSLNQESFKNALGSTQKILEQENFPPRPKQ